MIDKVLNFVDEHPGWTIAILMVSLMVIGWTLYTLIVLFAWNVLAAAAFGVEPISVLQAFAVAFFLGVIGSIFGGTRIDAR